MKHETMKPVERGWTADSQLERMLAYNVFDNTNEKIGHVSGLWTEPNGNVAFVGVKTTWFVGKTHMIPAEGMEVNHGRETIRVPYGADIVKNAPSYDPGAELDAAKEKEVCSYYSRYGRREARRTQTEEEVRIPLAEEELKVGKRVVEAGGVRLRKVVRSEPVQQEVELKREDIELERIPGQGAQLGDKSFESEDIYIPLRREEAVVQKEAHVREQVRARKKSDTERQTISDTIRKEELETAGGRSRE